MLITVSSVRGAPGVTSWAILLAAAWPTETPGTRFVLEADCDGGVLGARYQIGVEPGAVSLISACRREVLNEPVERHGGWLADRLCAIPGPEIGEQALAAWVSGATDVARQLADDPRIWFVDLGRAGTGSPLAPLLDTAEVNIVVAGPHVEDLVQLPARLQSLGPHRSPVVLVVGQPECDVDELRAFVAGTTLWLAPAVDQLPRMVAKVVSGGRSRRSALWRSALEVAADLAAMAGQVESRLPDDTSAGERPQLPAPPVEPTKKRVGNPDKAGPQGVADRASTVEDPPALVATAAVDRRRTSWLR